MTKHFTATDGQLKRAQDKNECFINKCELYFISPGMWSRSRSRSESDNLPGVGVGVGYKNCLIKLYFIIPGMWSRSRSRSRSESDNLTGVGVGVGVENECQTRIRSRK